MKQEKRKKSKDTNAPKRAKIVANYADVSLPSWCGGAANRRVSKELLLTGQGIVQVISGALEIDGFTLTPEFGPLPVSSGPAGGLALTLTATVSSSHQQVPRASQDIITFTIHNPSIPAQSTAGTAHTMPSEFEAQQVQRSSFQLHYSNNSPPSLVGGNTPHPPPLALTPPTLLVPPDWSQSIQHVLQAAEHHVAVQAPPVAVVVTGPKNSGKSTLTRMLVNRLLSQHPVVSFMDTDCGQSELTPPGLVSITLLTRPLLGPPCTHVQVPSCAHYIGDMSAQCDPMMYSQAVRSLHQWYCSEECPKAVQQAVQAQRQHSTSRSPQHDIEQREGEQQKQDEPSQPEGTWPPLIVNTHGWVKGVGLDVLTDLLNTVNPTHVIQIDTQFPRKNLPQSPYWWPGDPRACTTQLLTVFPPGNSNRNNSGNANSRPARLPQQQPQFTSAAAKLTSPLLPAKSNNDFGNAGNANGKAGGSSMKAVLSGRADAVASAPTVSTSAQPSYSGGQSMITTSEGGDLEADADPDPDNAIIPVDDEDADPEEATLVVGGAQGMSAVASRALQWHAWCRTVCGQDPAGSSFDSSDLYSSAADLCAAQPYAVDLDSFKIRFMHQDAPPDHLLGNALNGAVVGLATSQEQSMQEQDTALPVCFGLGLIRSVDMKQRKLFILTDVPESQLENVDVLLVGKAAAELPVTLLQAGAISAVSPYLSLFSLGGVSAAAAGATSGKSRRNIGRARLGGR